MTKTKKARKGTLLTYTFWVWYGIAFALFNFIIFALSQSGARWVNFSLGVIMVAFALWAWWLRRRNQYNTKINYQIDHLLDKADIEYENGSGAYEVIKNYIDPAIALIGQKDYRTFPWQKRKGLITTAEVTDEVKA